jgi:hypothetical protein
MQTLAILAKKGGSGKTTIVVPWPSALLGGSSRWPGNIRQLLNVIETTVLLAPSNHISVNELPEEIRTYANHESHFTVFLGSLLDEVEREFIPRTIAKSGGRSRWGEWNVRGRIFQPSANCIALSSCSRWRCSE